MKLEVLQPGIFLNGICTSGAVECVGINWLDGDRVEVEYIPIKGQIRQQSLTRKDETKISLALNVPPRNKSAATRERLLVKAAELFSEQGYDGTSLRDIARHLSMNVASIYYYYQTKDEILHAVLVRGVTSLHDAVSSAVQDLPANTTTRKKLEIAMESHLTSLAAGGEFGAVFSIYLHLPRNVRNTQNLARDSYYKLWMSLVEEGIETGEIKPEFDAKILRRLIIVVLTRSTEWEEVGQRDVATMTDFFTRVLFEGIATED